MNRIAIVIAVGFALVAILLAVPAQAQATRTFVSGNGADTGACTLAAPCRSFAYAIGQTAAGGEIAVLDTAGYGAVTITKSVTITNPGGVEAGIAVSSGGTAVTINIDVTDTVVLRGLTIEGAGIGANGIVFNRSGTLNVLDCVVRDMTQTGITITPSSGGTVVIADTSVANNNADGIVATASGSGTLAVTLSHVKAINNGFSGGGYGVRMIGTAASFGFATIDTSLIAENGIGLATSATSPNIVTAFVVNSNILNNNQSLSVGAETSVNLEKTSIAATSGGIANNGTISSFLDNAILDAVTGNAIQSKAFK